MSRYHTMMQALTENGTVKMKVHGNSMTPIIESGSLLTFVKSEKYKIGDIVFCKVRGRFIDAHKITKESPDKGFMIANNHGWENGWTKQIFGKVTEINGRAI